MSQDETTVLLQHHLKALKLPTILREHEAMARLCAKERSSYNDFLLKLTERELMDREQRAADRRLRDAKFPVLKTLDSFDFAAQPSINEAAVRELTRGEYLSGRENILIVGNPGTGKSHLATALGHAACMQGNRVRFFTVTGLVTQLLEHREERNLQRLHRQLERNRLLILDELGYVPFTNGRGRTALRRRQPGLRTQQPDRHDQSALRAMDGGDGQRTADRSVARPPDPPRSHPRGQRRKLPASRLEETTQEGRKVANERSTTPARWRAAPALPPPAPPLRSGFGSGRAGAHPEVPGGVKS